MKTYIPIILIGLISLVGCQSSGSSKKVSFKYPNDIHAICEKGRHDAKACIESKGTKLSYKKNLVLEKKPGTRKVGGEWVWKEPSLGNREVAGLTWDKGSHYLCQVACNPKTMNEVSSGVTKHEHGHYFLMSNFKNNTHDPMYKSCFLRWYDIKGMQLQCLSTEINGQQVVIDYFIEDTNNVQNSETN